MPLIEYHLHLLDRIATGGKVLISETLTASECYGQLSQDRDEWSLMSGLTGNLIPRRRLQMARGVRG